MIRMLNGEAAQLPVQPGAPQAARGLTARSPATDACGHWAESGVFSINPPELHGTHG